MVRSTRRSERTERFGEDQDTYKEWVELWAKEMVNIWEAKLKALSSERDWWIPEPIYDDKTRRHGWPHLQESVKLSSIMWEDPYEPLAGFTVIHTFNMYGLWVDTGSGREMGTMVRGNDGKFLGNQAGMTKKGRGALAKWTTTRKAKHWYSSAYWRSCNRLIEEAQDDCTNNFVWLMTDLQRSLSIARMKRNGGNKSVLTI